MGIRLEYGLSKDKRPDLNKDPSKARYFVPHIVRINFINEADNKLMFSFVPKCEDEETIIAAFNLLKEYDNKRMELFSFITNNLMEAEKQWGTKENIRIVKNVIF